MSTYELRMIQPRLEASDWRGVLVFGAFGEITPELIERAARQLDSEARSWGQVLTRDRCWRIEEIDLSEEDN